MTREHKLSLIIGFVLILIFGVLISDHMSAQRRIQLASVAVDDERSTLGVTEGISPVERWVKENASQIQAAAETEAVPPTLLDADPGAAPVSEPAALAADGSAQPAFEDGGPIMIPQGRLASADDGVTNLERALINAGGSVQRTGPEATLEVPSRQPESQPVRVPEADPKDDKIYRIQDKDSLYAIAKTNYGDASLWSALAKYNEGRVGKDGTVRVGATIKLPPRHVLTGEPAPAPGTRTEARKPEARKGEAAKPEASKPEPAKTTSKATTHTVVKGDTLSKIAEKLLGSKSRAGEIMALNKIADANQIRIGQVLKIPAR